MDSATHPPRLLHRLAALARWSLSLVLSLWLLLALVWALIYGWLLPRADHFTPQLQAWAEHALGVPVRVGALQARSDGLIPVLELHNVALLDAQGHPALSLARVVATFSPRSLLRLRLEQLFIERPELDLRRSAEGTLFIAGLALPAGQGSNHAAADWLFSQGEIVLQGGTVHYRDEQTAAPALQLTQVDMVLRNQGWQHTMRLDATPPPAWGQRLTLMGQFRQPFWSVHAGAWQRWTGQLYALLPHIDIAPLRPHLAALGLGLNVQQGQGALRAWVDLRQGQATGAVLDVRLAHLQAQAADAPQALALRTFSARITTKQDKQGRHLATQDLQFTTADGQRWPGGNVTLRQQYNRQGQATEGQWHADRLDLAALAHLGNALPLGAAGHTLLRTYQPQGQIHDLDVGWNAQDPSRYRAKGRASDLSLAAPQDTTAPQTFGLRGAQVNFDLTQDGGQAQLAMTHGALLLPGVFEEPVVPLQRLTAQVRWNVRGEHLEVHASDLQFANADAQGQAQLHWRTSDPAQASSGARFPGVLDLSGQLQRADGTRVHRYLPLVIDAQVRHYVRDAVQAGQSHHVQFKVRGDLHDLPFSKPEQGEFFIAAKVQDATYAYVPPMLQAAGELPWPVLTGLSGDLIFDRSALRVRNASTRFLGQAGLRAERIQADIADLAHSTVTVQAQARGPLAEMLQVVTHSPLHALTHQALAHTQASGGAQLQLQLALPLSDLAQSRIQGSVALAGNAIHLLPQVPPLEQVQGKVHFSEQGFGFAGLRAQALGGEVRLDGGMRHATAPILVRAQGQASAEGLRNTPALGLAAQLAQHASGSAPYQLEVSLRQGVPELRISTTLEGMALTLPAPLSKTAASSLPVRLTRQLTRTSAPLQDALTLTLGEAGSLGRAHYERTLEPCDASASSPCTPPQVIRGSMALGLPEGEEAPLPSSGVRANLRLEQLDVPAWQALLDASTHGPGDASASLVQYLPTELALRAAQVHLQGRTLHHLVAGISRQDTLWRANVQAQELDGYLQYREASQAPIGASVYARLARLALTQSTDTALDRLLQEQPAALPALDIVVQNFELHGYHLGHLEIEAQNRSNAPETREWRLRRFLLRNPDASFSGNGNWTLLASGAEAQRRTALQFELDIHDAGALLTRLDMPDVLRRGKGAMQGQLAWLGSPLNPDYRSMTGQVHMDVQAGQFLKADPGLAKLLGVLSLQSLPRRLTLDFRDVFSDGFSFDFVRGDLQIEKGIARTNNLQMKGVNAAVLMEGSADIEHETQDLHVVVVPEINAMTASLVATAINPLIGLGSFVAQALLRGPLAAAATQELRIQGTWSEPQVQRLSSSLPKRPPKE